jgi:hypothetical protein
MREFFLPGQGPAGHQIGKNDQCARQYTPEDQQAAGFAEIGGRFRGRFLSKRFSSSMNACTSAAHLIRIAPPPQFPEHCERPLTAANRRSLRPRRSALKRMKHGPQRPTDESDRDRRRWLILQPAGTFAPLAKRHLQAGPRRSFSRGSTGRPRRRSPN